jgi:hypothetical protein
MNKIIGQTGSVVLSDEADRYRLSQKRTVRYRYAKCRHGYRAEVIQPVHSATYGACSFGTKKRTAKAALLRNLANNYGYVGGVSFSNRDEADRVGLVDERLLDSNATVRPLTFADTCAPGC